MNDFSTNILLVENEHYLARALVGVITLGLGQAVHVQLRDSLISGADYINLVKVDLLIVDYQALVPSDAGLISTIKQQHPELPIILISEMGPDATAPSIAEYLSGHLQKPFELVKMIDLVKEKLNPSDYSDGSAGNGPEPANGNGSSNGNGHGGTDPHQTRILIVEDDPFTQRIYRKGLSLGNYDIHEASTLQQGRELLDQYQYDILICDMHVGNERGVDLLQEKQAEIQAGGTQTIIASAYGNYRLLTESLGADFFLEKPFSIATLMQLINRLAAHRQNVLSSAQPVLST